MASNENQHEAVAGDDLHQRLLSAIGLHQKGKVQDAMGTYREILAAFPNHPDALHFMGVAEAQTGHPDEAVKYISRALDIVPDHPDALNNRGNAFKRLGRLKDAEADYRKALAVRADDVNAMSNLGAVLRQRGELEQAEGLIRKVLELRPEHAAAWHNLGNVLESLGRNQEALQAHREAFRLSPQSANAYRQLGAILFAVGRQDEAKEIYRRWFEIFPSDPRARHFYAACSETDIPARASDDCVRAEFAAFAANFDASLTRLQYRAPALVDGELTQRLGSCESASPLEVLDAGCGTGLCGSFLRPRARRLVGVDLSGPMLEQAVHRQLYDELLEHELTAYLQQQKAAFDVIVSADTLVYFGALTDVLAATAVALRPGGILVFTVERISNEECAEGFHLHPHGRYSHTRDYLARELTAAGFTDLSFQEVDLRKEANAWVGGWLVSGIVGANLS
jgi:predicted TPR repeat methyltransferase